MLDDAILHHGNLGRQRHGLDLIVRDIHDGGAQPLVETFDLRAHVHAQLGVEVAEWLVKEE